MGAWAGAVMIVCAGGTAVVVVAVGIVVVVALVELAGSRGFTLARCVTDGVCPASTFGDSKATAMARITPRATRSTLRRVAPSDPIRLASSSTLGLSALPVGAFSRSLQDAAGLTCDFVSQIRQRWSAEVRQTELCEVERGDIRRPRHKIAGRTRWQVSIAKPPRPLGRLGGCPELPLRNPFGCEACQPLVELGKVIVLAIRSVGCGRSPARVRAGRRTPRGD